MVHPLRGMGFGGDGHSGHGGRNPRHARAVLAVVSFQSPSRVPFPGRCSLHCRILGTTPMDLPRACRAANVLTGHGVGRTDLHDTNGVTVA